MCTQFVKALLVDHMFNEEVYQGMKSTTKFRFLHIGFKLWQLVVDNIAIWDNKLKARE